jgi:hypothetical protein
MYHTEQVGMVVTFCTCIQEVPVENCSSYIQYPDSLWLESPEHTFIEPLPFPFSPFPFHHSSVTPSFDTV